jgi:hypothetical protein
MELFKNGLRNQSDLKAPEPITTKLAEPSGTGIRALLSDIIEAANALQQAREDEGLSDPHYEAECAINREIHRNRTPEQKEREALDDRRFGHYGSRYDN